MTNAILLQTITSLDSRLCVIARGGGNVREAACGAFGDTEADVDVGEVVLTHDCESGKAQAGVKNVGRVGRPLSDSANALLAREGEGAVGVHINQVVGVEELERGANPIRIASVGLAA